MVLNTCTKLPLEKWTKSARAEAKHYFLIIHKIKCLNDLWFMGYFCQGQLDLLQTGKHEPHTVQALAEDVELVRAKNWRRRWGASCGSFCLGGRRVGDIRDVQLGSSFWSRHLRVHSEGAFVNPPGWFTRMASRRQRPGFGCGTPFLADHGSSCNQGRERLMRHACRRGK